MVKTTVYLPEDIKEALTRISESEGRSEAELIRDALRKSIRERTPPKPKIPLYEFDLGDPTLADRVDELLTGFGAK